MSIEIIKTDITEMEVDAIVNAANTSLLRGGGVCGAIFKKAGFDLDKECQEIGHCNTGEAVITKGYGLKAKYIIHTVAPIWNDYRNEKNREELFKNCYYNIFKIAIEKQIKTIAIPCIGTGIYGCPIELGRDYAFEMAKKVEDKFDKIYFVCFEDKEFEIYNNWYKYNFKFEEEENLKENSKKLPKLKSRKVEWEKPKKLEDGIIEIGFPLYDEEVNNWLHEFYRLKLADYNYIDNFKIYKYKKIEELSLEETLSYITFIIRGERFCDGHIASYLEDGTIEKLCNNL